MKQFKSLLVGLKLDECDVPALQYAGMISRMAESQRVSFVHIVEALELPESAREEYPELTETPADVAEEKMRKHVADHFGGHPDSELRFDVDSGSPTNELLQHIRLHGIDLAIVGDAADKRDGGTVPERLSRKAPCSVMVVPEGCEPTINKILVPLDFSEHSAEALRIAAVFARGTGCQEIHCLHTFDVPNVWRQAGRTYDQFCQMVQGHTEDEYKAFIKGVDLADLKVSARFVPNERPARVIEQAIDKDQPDLVVMGARGRTNAAAVLLGSVTERVIRRTRVPLLAVKKKGEGLEFLEALLSL